MPFPGLPAKPTYEMAIFTSTGSRFRYRPSVPANDVLSLLTDWMTCFGGDLKFLIDGQDFTAAARATPAIYREVARRRGLPVPSEPEDSGGRGHVDVPTAWRFLLTDDQVLHRLPLVSHVGRDETLRGGPGPGGLFWQPITDHGMLGLRAAHSAGTFKILRVGADRCALVYERTQGDWEAIATGTPDALKERADLCVRRSRPTLDLPPIVVPPERVKR